MKEDEGRYLAEHHEGQLHYEFQTKTRSCRARQHFRYLWHSPSIVLNAVPKFGGN